MRSYPFATAIFSVLMLWLICGSVQAQELTSGDKRAIKAFYEAVDSYQRNNFDKALVELAKAIQYDENFTEAYILQGDIRADQQQPAQAIESYQRAVSTNRKFSPNLYYILANTQLSIGRYSDAANNYNRFIETGNVPEAKLTRSRSGLQVCAFALDCIAHPVPFVPFNLGDSINSAYDEYVNAITADDQLLYFTRKRARDAQTVDQSRAFEEDFYRSVKPDSSWYRATSLGPPINTHGNEGALTISPDGQYLFFAACNRDDSYGSCDIYWAARMGDRWTTPENLGPVVNSTSWDSQPSFSSDGKTLYFASKRAGGKGSSDIWRCELLADKQWSVPVNLGDSVNTLAEEMAPFIHPDDQTLYFSSKGHLGMGGLDLFMVRKGVDGRWVRPVNLGYPINTFADEITLLVNSRGDLAYISSDMPGGKGRQDIYQFPLYKEAQPQSTTYFKGIVFDSETKARLEASFELIDLSSGKVIARANSDRISGEFLLTLPINHEYALNVSRAGYLFHSDHFSLTGQNTGARPFIRNVPLKAIRVGETVILRNIFFDTDKYTLKPESVNELDRLTSLLKQNPRLRIEISGHTDNEGSPAYNTELSQNRAKRVFEYLTQAGIPGERLTYKGYGMDRPVDVNTTAEGRANNRRTEFRVISN